MQSNVNLQLKLIKQTFPNTQKQIIIFLYQVFIFLSSADTFANSSTASTGYCLGSARNTVDSGSGPTRLTVPFHLMARPAREQNHSVYVETKYPHPLSHSDKV